jgi:predicted PurR-regulated permease PerM
MMLLAMLLIIWLALVVIRPLLEPILLAAALALLTAPVLFEPLERFVGRLVPFLDPGVRRRIAGVAAAAILVAVLLTPFLVVLISTLGSAGGVLRLVIGVLTKDPESIERLVELIGGQIEKLHEMYPALGLDDVGVAEQIGEMLKEATAFGPSLFQFLFQGTSSIGEIVLALITLAFFVAEGPGLVRQFLRVSPLSEELEMRLIARHRQIVLRLLVDTVGTAVVKGTAVGAVAWGCFALAGKPLPFVLIALLAGFLSLLPMVGLAVVFLPLAGLLWGTGHQLLAVLLVVASLVTIVGLDLLRQRLTEPLEDRGAWMGFLLFLGLLGGLLGFGLQGLVIGPVAVVLGYSLATTWLPVYGVGSDEGSEKDGLESPPQ